MALGEVVDLFQANQQQVQEVPLVVLVLQAWVVEQAILQLHTVFLALAEGVEALPYQAMVEDEETLHLYPALEVGQGCLALSLASGVGQAHL